LNIAILGAGITGLTIGHRLAEKAPGLDFTLFEQSPCVGGLLRSARVDGFTYDAAGGHIIYTRDPTLRNHLHELLGGRIVENRRETRIFFKGRYVNYPFENGLGDLAREDNFNCLKGYVDAYVARETGTATEPTNLREWILWRFGEGIANAFMFPYNEKIWKSDLTDMSYEWVSGRVPDAPPDDVLKSAVGIRTEGYTHQLLFSYPLEGGIQSLADATAEPIRHHIRLETPVDQVCREGDRWRVNGQIFDRVVSTLPLGSIPDILEDMDSTVVEAARSLRHVNLLCFLIGLDYPTPVPYSWIYLPHDSNGPVNRLTHLSNYSPRNVPPECSSVMCEVTFRGDTPPDPDRTLSEIITCLDDADIIQRSHIIATAVSRVDHAYPFYDLDFGKNIQVVRDHLDDIGFDTCGRTGRMEYFNTDHCVAAGFRYVDRILEKSTDPRSPS